MFTTEADTFIEKTIDTELDEELTFLANYDRARTTLCEIVDMPDRLVPSFLPQK